VCVGVFANLGGYGYSGSGLFVCSFVRVGSFANLWGHVATRAAGLCVCLCVLVCSLTSGVTATRALACLFLRLFVWLLTCVCVCVCVKRCRYATQSTDGKVIVYYTWIYIIYIISYSINNIFLANRCKPAPTQTQRPGGQIAMCHLKCL
jgi:hypothetical protein